MDFMRNLLKDMIQREASDMFLREEATVHMRIYGVVKSIGPDILNQETIQKVTQYLLHNDERRTRFKQRLDIDFAHWEKDVGRFRINIFTQRGTPAIVIRHVPEQTKSFEDLNLPADLLRIFCEESSGLVLICGPAGSGKSTSIASMIDYINNRREKHIVTIEDPIEYIFSDKKCIINQRELGLDVHSYSLALKHVTQQSPDIIYIGNIRDVDTMRATINATELGTFAITTLHTINAVQTITRIVNFFPPYLHDEVRMQLSVILKGVISLRLLPRFDIPGRIPAYETMVVTPTISRLIREGKVNEIQKFIDDGELFGMQSFKHSLVQLVKRGIVSEEDARHVADSKDDFNLELKGLRRYLK